MKNYVTLIAALAVPLLAAQTGRAQTGDAQAGLEQAQATVQAEMARAQQVRQLLGDAKLAPQETYVIAQASAQSGEGGPEATLVVPKESAEPKELAALEEDLKIMGHILHKAAHGDGEKAGSAMGIMIHERALGAAEAPHNLYLEGYGALFFLEVNYPLIAPSGKRAEAEAKEETSSEWEEARRELFQEPAGTHGFALNFEELNLFGGPKAEPYDADKVESLKTDVITALKNGSHIRKLRADETLTVVVAGRGGRVVHGLITRNLGKGAAGGTGGRMVTRTVQAGSGGHGGRLIVRAKKADMDAFQKDKLSLEEFRKKVTVILN
jgi:hypothetical protein